MMICHSVLDTESKIPRKEWIPAFAGMTTLGIHPKSLCKTKPIRFLVAHPSSLSGATPGQVCKNKANVQTLGLANGGKWK